MSERAINGSQAERDAAHRPDKKRNSNDEARPGILCVRVLPSKALLVVIPLSFEHMFA
jgi:hypothetical protein